MCGHEWISFQQQEEEGKGEMEEKISQDVGTEDSGEWPSHKEATVNAVQGEDWGWG